MMRVLTPLRIGIAVGLLIALLRSSSLVSSGAIATAVEAIAARAFDTRLASRGTVTPGNEVVIVAVDDASLDAVGRWPWPRATIARLIDRITEDEAAVIGFDLVQSEASEDDTSLVESVARSQRSVLGYYFDFNQHDPRSLEKRVSSYSAAWNAPAELPNLRVRTGTALRGNLPALTERAKELGYFNFFPDEDGSYRRVPLVIRAGERFAMPLSLAMLHLWHPDWTMGVRFVGDGVDSIQVGPTRIPVADDGQMLINYRGPGHTFLHVSAADVLSGKAGKDRFKDKLVLVGVTATAVADIRVSPLDSQMPGVEIHANAIDSILRNDFLWSSSSLSGLVESSVIFVLSLLLGACLTRLRGLRGMLAAAWIAILYYVASQWFFLQTGMSLSVMFPISAIGLTYAGVGLQHYIVEEGEKRRNREVLELYLSPAVAKLVSDKPELLTLGGDTRDLTVMFLDIRGFTTTSERMRDRPHDLVALLNEFLDAMSQVIFEHEGTVDKYVGDEIMAFWGAPIAQADHADRACRTALALIERLHELNLDFVKRGWPALDIGIGIHSGPMVVGNMGSRRRFCYTVVGDNVNLAARLEGLNRKYGTHIIASATSIASADVLAREVDMVRVRGKDQAVHVFEIVAGKGAEPEWRSIIEPFHRGLAHYRSQRWEEAKQCFRQSLSLKADDPPSRLYLERIEWFEANPPPVDWDGVTVMETK